MNLRHLIRLDSWSADWLFFGLVILCLSKVEMTWGQSPTVKVDEFGRFLEHAATSLMTSDLAICYSANGLYRCEYRFSQAGFDHFQVADLRLFRSGKLICSIANPCGSGFYVSNSGLIAAIDAEESSAGKCKLVFYSPNGEFLTRAESTYASDFAFSQNGKVFAFNSVAGITLIEPEQRKSFQLPRADLFTLSITGDSVAAISEGRLSLWRKSDKLAEFSDGPKWPRKLAFSPDGQCIACIGKNTVKVFSLLSGKVLLQKSLPKDQTYQDLRWQNDRLELGIRERSKGTLRGVHISYDLSGRQIDSSKTQTKDLPVGLTRPEGLLYKPAIQDSVSWPFPPFNIAYPIGNTYEEYQNYGGDPYLHPGSDLLAPDNTPVFSVAEGTVKAVLTIDAQYHWRIAVGDSTTAGYGKGWLYAHLIQSSIPWAVGDTIHVSDFLGELVPWPIADFTHCHFVRIQDEGEIWTMPWDAISNPLEVLRPKADETPPVFHLTRGRDSLAFCANESSLYLDPFALVSKVDIIAQVGDYVGHPDWECSIYRMEYEMIDLLTNKRVLGPVPSMILSHVLPAYTGTPKMAHVIYKNDLTCNSEGNYVDRDYFMIVTNTDGDSLLELSDADSALNTALFPDGPYRIIVRAFDAAANMSEAGMNVEFVNGVSNGIAAENASPKAFRLEKNFPNPFNCSTQIFYDVDRPGCVAWSIFDIAGRTVFTDQAVHDHPGKYQFVWLGVDDSGQTLPSGVYFAEAKLGAQKQIIKMALTK
jgi:hypothetical protein